MRVALAFDINQGFSGAVLRGVAAFARPGRDWIFDHDGPTPEGLERLVRGKPDGIIIAAADDHCAHLITGRGVPVVNVGSVRFEGQAAEVVSDHRRVGELAAEYFLSRRHRNFAFYGLKREYSHERWLGFFDKLVLRGASEPLRYLAGEEGPPIYGKARERLEEWLRSLAKPTALFCDTDYSAWAAAEAARVAGLGVPSSIAILGVDNDPTICELAYPQLSSIHLAGERIGYESAQLIENLIQGVELLTRSLSVPPLRVVERQSTDVLICADDLVSAALKYMRANVGYQEDIENLCSRIGTSRRNFERRFRAATAETPAQVWARFRVEAAQRLLIETDLGLEVIASESGFSDTHHLHVTFKRLTSTTPLGFRRSARPASK